MSNNVVFVVLCGRIALECIAYAGMSFGRGELRRIESDMVDFGRIGTSHRLGFHRGCRG